MTHYCNRLDCPITLSECCNVIWNTDTPRELSLCRNCELGEDLIKLSPWKRMNIQKIPRRDIYSDDQKNNEEDNHEKKINNIDTTLNEITKEENNKQALLLLEAAFTLSEK